MRARYSRWDCSCGDEETVELELGERPATLPEWVQFPYHVLRCRCGGMLNIVVDQVTCAHDFLPVFVDGCFMGEECRYSGAYGK